MRAGFRRSTPLLAWFSSGGGNGFTRVQQGHRLSRAVIRRTEDLLERLTPLLEWVWEYENRIRHLSPAGYRARCHALYERQPRSRSWLDPEAAQEWLGQLLSGEVLPIRARRLLRRRRA